MKKYDINYIKKHGRMEITMNQATWIDMRKMIDSMEETVKMQNRANAERRA